MKEKRNQKKLSLAECRQPSEPEHGDPFTTAMNQLTPEERSVCEWRRLGFSNRQIARYLGNSVAAVNTLYSKAMAKIRRLLK